MPRLPAVVELPGFKLVRFEFRGPRRYDRYGRSHFERLPTVYLHIPDWATGHQSRAYNYARDNGLLTQEQIRYVQAAPNHYCQIHRYLCSCNPVRQARAQSRRG